MAKYIIDIPDDGQCQYRYNEDTKELKFPCPRLDPNSFMGLDITISGVTPYTEPDREAIEDEVWEFARHLINVSPSVTEDIYWSMNGGKGIEVAVEMSYQEARAKYDEWRKKKEEIHVGDEVEQITVSGNPVGFKCVVTKIVNKYDGEDKICNDLTFTLNYSDGTKALVDRGILFSLGDDDRMYIHLGVSKAWEVFGVARCLNDFIKICGMEDLFEKYLRAMEAEDKGRRTRT